MYSLVLASHVAASSLLARASEKAQLILFCSLVLMACWGLSLRPAVAQMFAAKVDYPTDKHPSDKHPYTVAVGDFNLDGKPDLVTASFDNATVRIFLNNGTGQFTTNPDAVYATYSQPTAIAVGDLNVDGKPDLAVANQSRGVSVHLNNGDGTFAQKRDDYPAGSNSYNVAIGDFNLDGKPDLVVASYASRYNVNVFINKGDGTFLPKAPYPAGLYGYAVTVADFNVDGKPDLAVANFGDSTISIFRNIGEGKFTLLKRNYETGAGPRRITWGDFNSDGKPDLVTANTNTSTVSVFINHSDGTGEVAFASGEGYTVGSNPRSVAVGDFNRDGKPDLAVANGISHDVSVLINEGDGTFALKVDFPTGTNPFWVAVGDFNGDCRPDLVTANYGSSTLSVLRRRPVPWQP